MPGTRRQQRQLWSEGAYLVKMVVALPLQGSMTDRRSWNRGCYGDAESQKGKLWINEQSGARM